MLKATTPKGHSVEVKAYPVGTASEQGTISMGGVKLSFWNPHDCGGNNNLEEALVAADKRIESMELCVE